MNRLLIFPLLALVLVTACQKKETEAERQAEIERQVQQRLAADRQTQEQQRLSQGQVDLNQRVQGLENQQNEASAPSDQAGQAAQVTDRSSYRDDDEGAVSADYETFYDRLEPEGDWIETSTYGYVWQPNVATRSRSWRPYTDGRWVYTDAGWTWISEERFGWATYHYGRWTRIRNVGWVWVPGNQWAPAWVSWRASDDYVGWAPLPPEARFERGSGIHGWADSYYDIGPEQYCFVPTVSLGEQRIEQVVLPAEQNITIVNRTTNVTNITYNNTVIVNNGPNYDQVRTRSRRPIERLKLERQTNINVATTDSRPVIKGDAVQMAAPVIPRAQRVERPKQVKRNLAQVEVERGWENIADRQAVEQARTKIRSEATPPPNAPPKRFVRPGGAGTNVAPAASAPAPKPVTGSSPSASLPPNAAATVSPEQRRRPAMSPAASATPSPTASTAVATATPSPMSTPTPTSTPATPLPTATPTPAPPLPTATVTPEQTASPRQPNLPPRKVSPTPRSDATAVEQQTPTRRGFVPVPATRQTPSPTASPGGAGVNAAPAGPTPTDARGPNGRAFRRQPPLRDRASQAQQGEATATPGSAASPESSATQPNEQGERNLGVAPHGPPRREGPRPSRRMLPGSPIPSPTPTPTT